MLPAEQTRVETFPGAACLKRFVVLHTPRRISLGLLSPIQSGSPPVLLHFAATRAAAPSIATPLTLFTIRVALGLFNNGRARAASIDNSK